MATSRRRRDPPWDEVTTAELVEAAGLENSQALMRWVRRGVLLAAVGQVGNGPGKGTRLQWPQGALERARWFRMMRERHPRSNYLTQKLLEALARQAGEPPPERKPRRPRASAQ